ncbi:hypothetical protein SDC9_94854 [bioreactor metagenome]|uniref:Uncharacterized protein n=1 Tax=bioreactor metagenome TaxID=1076179 RepID=A0A645A4X5_9ZZZZ
MLVFSGFGSAPGISESYSKEYESCHVIFGIPRLMYCELIAEGVPTPLFTTEATLDPLISQTENIMPGASFL